MDYNITPFKLTLYLKLPLSIFGLQFDYYSPNLENETSDRQVLYLMTVQFSIVKEIIN